jgi:hypothetical protein
MLLYYHWDKIEKDEAKGEEAKHFDRIITWEKQSLFILLPLTLLTWVIEYKYTERSVMIIMTLATVIALTKITTRFAVLTLEKRKFYRE